MQDNQSNNKRIAKNTLLLYGRMLLMMIISLYTSRVVLNALGVDDYGIYNVVGGVVGMFSILSGSISAAIGRFITVEIGKGDTDKLKKIFISSINVQLTLIAIITILLETCGLWFLNCKMVIPDSRLIAANWAFQFSVVTFAVNLWSIPYNAVIVAHERMSVFAYISIIEAISKLIVAFLIICNPIDRLIYYGILILLVGLLQRYIYTAYCKKHFEECQYELMFDKFTIKEIFGFAGWNFIGSASAILRDAGGNIIINLFYGPAVNAARSVAMTVNGAVTGFVSNFMTALNPQITKNYAQGNYEYMFNLVFQGARLSYYILLIITLPIIFTAPYLMHLWLGTVPEHTSNFACLVLIFTLSESLANPLVTLMLATGRIRNYQLVVGGCQLLNLPISYILLRFGYPPETIFVVAICVSILCEMTRLIMLRNMVKLSVRAFLKNVYFNVIVVTFIASIFPYIVLKYIKLEHFGSFIALCTVSIVSAGVSIYTIGCSKHDRKIINTAIYKVKNRLKH